MASTSAVVLAASIATASLAHAQQRVPPASPPVAPQKQSQPASSPFPLPLLPMQPVQLPFEIRADAPIVAQPAFRATLPPPCHTHGMPMRFADPNFDSKMVIKGAAPKPPCT